MIGIQNPSSIDKESTAFLPCIILHEASFPSFTSQRNKKQRFKKISFKGLYKIPIPQDSLIQACDNNNNNNNNNNQEPITDPVMIHCLLGTN